jgi:hypothetical protein
MKIIKSIIFFLLLSITSIAQKPILNQAPSDSLDKPNIPESILNSTSISLYSSEFVLSISILIFGLIVIILEVYLGYLKVIDASQIMKCIILTLVIISSLVLITAGYSNNQISGISGILGSIAGYLLAKTNSSHDKN